MSRRWHALYLLIIAILGYLVVRPRPLDPHAVEDALVTHTDGYRNVTWLGVPIWQPVIDLQILQETLFEIKPDLMIECGTYKGGSAKFFGDLFELMGHGRVITVDVEKQHNLTHPRVTFLIGDCTSPEIVSQIRAERDKVTGPVMVMLDSLHSAEHVRKELDAYHTFITPGSYIHVQDTALDVLEQWAMARPGPMRAVEAFIAEHPEFEIDAERSTKYLFTQHPKGWLRRKAN